MTARVDVAARNALRAVNAAYTRLPINLRDRLDVASPDADARVNAAIRSGDEAAALAAIRDWRDLHLARCERAAA